MDSTTISSVYIPRMSAFVRTEDIAYEFGNRYSSHVARVDFTPCNKTPGFVEDITQPFKSAFVHFMVPIDRYVAAGMVQAFMHNKAYKHETALFKEYWLILPNKNPVQHTMMNNAQIVENCRYLEKKVIQQGQEIETLNGYCNDLENRLGEQQSSINALEDEFDSSEKKHIQSTDELKNKMELQDNVNRNLRKQINNIFDTMVEVIRGLYNPETQNGIIAKHFSKLSEYAMSEEQRIAYMSCDIFPTTRQGDACEKRIEALEKKLKEITQIQPLDEAQNIQDAEALIKNMAI
jgi:uncharacterized coiled-coil protein SlyX